MTAPNTNIEKQRKRHRGPLIGISVGLAFVACIAFFAIVWPGIPLDEQAAADGVPTETADGDPVDTPDPEEDLGASQ